MSLLIMMCSIPPQPPTSPPTEPLCHSGFYDGHFIVSISKQPHKMLFSIHKLEHPNFSDRFLIHQKKLYAKSVPLVMKEIELFVSSSKLKISLNSIWNH